MHSQFAAMVKKSKKTSSAKPAKPASPPKLKVTEPTTNDPFRLSDFARKMLRLAEDHMKKEGMSAAMDSKCLLRWGSAFDGLNAPSHVFKAFGIASTQIFGAEIAKAPRVLSFRNTPPEHLFEDARALARKNSEFFCVRHWQKCVCETTENKRPHIFIGGFVCKSNSLHLGRM